MKRREGRSRMLIASKNCYPTLQLRPWSERPGDDGRAALVAVGTYNSGAELWLINVGGAWHIVSRRWWVV
jgi:hypothetical protein